MKFIVWNIRGLSHPSKQKKVRKLVRRLKVSLCCIVETQVRWEKAENIKESIVPGWGILNNYRNHPLGKIWVCKNKDLLEVQVVNSHAQAINCTVKSVQGNLSWFHSFVYGSNNGLERRKLWQFSSC
jgi:hypothetical protein